jgi:S1-C subfamily serine protease
MNRYLWSLVALLSVLPHMSPKAVSDAPDKLDHVLGVTVAPGAFVMSISPGSPAEQVGLDGCDLIAGFNGGGFQSYGDTVAFVGAMRAAAMFSGADLLIWRSADSGQTYHQERFPIRIPSQPGSKLGIDVTFQVLVLSVLKDGPADAGGMQAGEFIHQVNGQPVSDMRSISELDRRIGALARQNGEVLLTLARWKPVRGSADWKTSFTTREVVVRLSDRKP